MAGARTLACTPIPVSTPVWRQVLEGLPVPIAVADAQACIVAMNPAFRLLIAPRDCGDQIRVDPEDDGLIIAIRTAAAGPPSAVYQAASTRGVCFECRRLDDDGDLVALIGTLA
jgi:PAS domain-containing protein